MASRSIDSVDVSNLYLLSYAYLSGKRLTVNTELLDGLSALNLSLTKNAHCGHSTGKYTGLESAF